MWETVPSYKIWLGIIFIVLNLVALDVWLIKSLQTPVTPAPKNSVNMQSQSQSATSSVCPQACLSQIYQATSLSTSNKTQVAPTSTLVSPASSALLPSVTPPALVKEFFIPFGSTTTTASDWQDTGLTVTLNTANLGKIKSVVFEATIYVPDNNQTVWIQLYNETGQHLVWNSQMNTTGTTPQLLTSQPVTLDSGNNTYQIQMKTQLQSLTNLEQARLHIITY